ncbi:YihE protein a ser/thr kinase implicated inLPS synthesis and Cpx signaling [Salmonella enterica subsp. enterica]|nr:YihE protein a ser/thr kinase implicated inLPS synthesis and Cpx signaling [Salmonella enterica subsp. enterica]
MLLNGDKAEQRMQLETIIEAYEEVSEFDTAEIGLIEPLRAMRLVYYLAWLIRRWGRSCVSKKLSLVNRGRLLAATDNDFY